MTGPLHRAAPGQQKRLFNGDSEDSDPAQGLRLQASRPVGRRDRGDREADRREGRRPDSAAHPDQQVHRPPQPARRQEVARAVRDPHAQAAPRHPRADSADARRAHEARSLRRRGRGDQVVEATMAKFDVYDLEKKKVGELDLADAVFAGEVNEHLFYEVVKAKLASDRSGTHAVKNRSLVSGGGKKPWKQKHTGRARAGSTRASHFVGGGKAMGPKPRDYSYDVPRKVRKAALRAALALRSRDQKLVIVQEWRPAAAKTRTALVVDAAANVALAKSVRNLAGSDFLPVEGLNVYDILRHDALVLTADTAKQLEVSLS